MKERKNIFRNISCFALSLMTLLVCSSANVVSSTEALATGNATITETSVTRTGKSRYAFSEESVVLQKREGETFKALVLPDLQLEENDRADGEWAKTTNMVTDLIEETQPNLLILLGDMVWENATAKTMQDVADFIDSFQIPWAPVFGNHEGDTQMQVLTGLTKEKIIDIMEKSEYCLFEEGKKEVSGEGNYAVNLVDVSAQGEESLAWSFILMDSHGYDIESGYDHLKKDQISWYADYIQKLTILSNKGKAEETWVTPQSMLFMHIALPEYVTAYDKWVANGKDANSGYGERRKTGSEARVNSGMFNQILYSGSTTDVFVGHQHTNDFGVMYKGVWLRYALKTGPCLGDLNVMGGTLITINADNTRTVKNIYKQ